jgi:hypothetical protein
MKCSAEQPVLLSFPACPVLPPASLLQLWLRSPVAATTVKLNAALNCPAPVTSSVAVRFEEPFEAVTWVTGECHMHSLVKPSPAYEAAAAAVVPGQGLPSGRSKALPLAIGQPVMAQVSIAGEGTTCLRLKLLTWFAWPAVGPRYADKGSS